MDIPFVSDNIRRCNDNQHLLFYQSDQKQFGSALIYYGIYDFDINMENYGCIFVSNSRWFDGLATLPLVISRSAILVLQYSLYLYFCTDLWSILAE